MDITAGLAKLKTQINKLERRIHNLDMDNVNAKELHPLIESLNALKARYKEMQEEHTKKKESKEKAKAEIPVESAVPVATPPLPEETKEPIPPMQQPMPDEHKEAAGKKKKNELDQMVQEAVYGWQIKMTDISKVYAVAEGAYRAGKDVKLAVTELLKMIATPSDVPMTPGNPIAPTADAGTEEHWPEPKKKEETRVRFPRRPERKLPHHRVVDVPTPEVGHENEPQEKQSEVNKFAIHDVVEPTRGTPGSLGRVMGHDEANDMVYVAWHAGNLKDSHGYGAYSSKDLKKHASKEENNHPLCSVDGCNQKEDTVIDGKRYCYTHSWGKKKKAALNKKAGPGAGREFEVEKNDVSDGSFIYNMETGKITWKAMPEITAFNFMGYYDGIRDADGRLVKITNVSAGWWERGQANVKSDLPAVIKEWMLEMPHQWEGITGDVEIGVGFRDLKAMLGGGYMRTTYKPGDAFQACGSGYLTSNYDMFEIDLCADLQWQEGISEFEQDVFDTPPNEPDEEGVMHDDQDWYDMHSEPYKAVRKKQTSSKDTEVVKEADDEENVSGENEPSDDDIFIQDDGPLGAETIAVQGGEIIARLDNTEDANWDYFYEEIAAWMKKNSFFPTVWSVSDHGNYHVAESFYEHSTNHQLEVEDKPALETVSAVDDMPQSRAEELAESFINGNISYVRSKVRRNKNLLNEVAEFLQEFAPNELESFVRLMSRTASLNKKATSWNVMENGDLQITLDPESAKEVDPATLDSDNTMYDLFEPVVANGLSWVSPEDIGALTDAPILSDSPTDDQGNPDPKANYWWYPNYQVESPVRELVEKGSVIFKKASKDTTITKTATVTKHKDGWHVMSEEGKNLGGPYKSKEEAVKRLRQVEYFKHQGSLKEAGKYTGDIDKDLTVLLPHIVADGVAGQDRDLSDWLVERARQIYKHNPDWGKKVARENDAARDFLAQFMAHWLKAKQANPDLSNEASQITAADSTMETKCESCGKELGPEAFLSKWPVCGACTKKRHKKVTQGSAKVAGDQIPLNVFDGGFYAVETSGQNPEAPHGYAIFDPKGQQVMVITTAEPVSPERLASIVHDEYGKKQLVRATLKADHNAIKTGTKLIVSGINRAKKEIRLAMENTHVWVPFEKVAVTVDLEQHIEQMKNRMTDTQNTLQQAVTTEATVEVVADDINTPPAQILPDNQKWMWNPKINRWEITVVPQ